MNPEYYKQKKIFTKVIFISAVFVLLLIAIDNVKASSSLPDKDASGNTLEIKSNKSSADLIPGKSTEIEKTERSGQPDPSSQIDTEQKPIVEHHPDGSKTLIVPGGIR